MTRAEYDAIVAANWSTIKELGKSPAHYSWRIRHQRPDSSTMRRGRAVHVAVLQPELFAETYIIYDQGVRRGKKWDAFKAEHADKEILSEGEFRQCMMLQSAVRRSMVAAKYLERGEAEVPVMWVDPSTQIDCKGLIDWVGTGAIVDLKTTKDASPNGFAREVLRYGYHSQLSFYRDGWAASHDGSMRPVVIIAVEAEPPHAVTVFAIPDHVLQIGQEHVRELLNLLSFHRAQNDWPGYAETLVQLELPAWALASDESESRDVSGLGLEFEHHGNEGESA